jgi:hypothetical protein
MPCPLFEKTMAKLIENTLIIQSDEGFYPKDWTRHQYVYASWKPSKQGKVKKIIKTLSSYHQAIAKTDTDSELDTDADIDTE